MREKMGLRVYLTWVDKKGKRHHAFGLLTDRFGIYLTNRLSKLKFGTGYFYFMLGWLRIMYFTKEELERMEAEDNGQNW